VRQFAGENIPTFVMMSTSAEIESKLQQLKPILASRFHVSKIGYFGSYARQTQTRESDLDLLVEFSKPPGWDFFTLEKFLEDQFKLKIDLVTTNALKSQLKDSILKQVHFV
jgi:predicted nucleotidyltransferase